MRAIDRISDALALVGAVLMFLTGAFLTYEVAGRYVFNAPTTWAQEVSETCLLWGVFLSIGAMIHHRHNISIDIVFAGLSRNRQRAMETVALLFVLAFLVLVVKAGAEIAWDSVTRGTTTGTMVDIPSYYEEAAVPIGCAWAAVQTIVELIRAITGRGWEPHLHAGAES